MLDLLLFLLLGVVSGLLSGLLGIGGGAVVVPGLLFIFTVMHVPHVGMMQLAAGTSLAILMFTSLGSAWYQIRAKTVMWPVFVRMTPWILLGVIVGSLLGSWVSTNMLKRLFAVFLFIVGAKMLLKIRIKPGKVLPPKKSHVRIAGGSIGLMSGLLGVGGGTISVPFLVHNQIPMRNAVGTTTVVTLFVAVIGALSLTLVGLGHEVVSWSLGYVYWPAVLCVVPLSLLFSHHGVKLGQKLKPDNLRRFFALLLLVLAFKIGGVF